MYRYRFLYDLKKSTVYIQDKILSYPWNACDVIFDTSDTNNDTQLSFSEGIISLVNLLNKFLRRSSIKSIAVYVQCFEFV